MNNLFTKDELKERLRQLKRHRVSYAVSHDELPFIKMEIANMERILTEVQHD